MNAAIVQKIIGILLLMCSFMMLPPVLVGMIYQDGDIWPFIEGFATLVIIGGVLFIPNRKQTANLSIRSGFLVAAASWIIVGLAGALPLYLSHNPELSLTDSVFESISGLTTTGATILTNIDVLSHALKFYRQQLQWFGGMGIIVLAVAVLPMLRIGGMQIYKAEIPGPMKDQKLTPRIAETAKALVYIYLSITIICAFSYYLVGMNPFDAICHSFTTVSTGGLSPYDASMGHFNNALIELIAVVFMVISAVSFASHFTAWKSNSIKAYINNTEVKAFLFTLMLVSIGVSMYLYTTGETKTLFESFRQGTFQVVSFGTTTGYSTEPFYLWAGALPFLLIIISALCGCAGSTAGGLKMIRVIFLFKITLREFHRLIHPHGKFLIKVNGKVINYRVLDSIAAFFVLFIFLFVVFTLLLLLFGEDLITALTTSLSSLTSLGPALGTASSHYADMQDASKWILSMAMIFGRLELFTLFILLIPDYWEY